MSGNVDITGYAIISDDDRIAAADGLAPASLRNEKDWELYQRAQELADLAVFARRSHELEPNSHQTPRVVVSRIAAGVERRPDGFWWNPLRVTWEDVAARLLPTGGRVAVCGGQVAFDLFLMIGFDGFHLARAKGVRLPGGEPVFSICNSGVRAETALVERGLKLSGRIPLDPDHGVELTVWRRAAD